MISSKTLIVLASLIGTPNYLMISSKTLIVLASLIGSVKAHGYLKSPRSRNFVAFEDGVESGTASDPAKEYCPQCLNRGGPLAACGLVENHNYDQPPNAVGGVMGPNVQATFAPGSQIDVDVVLTAHHKGHFEFYACPITAGETPTAECFKNHPLEFVEDLLYGATKDPNYPHRAYIPPLSYPNILSEPNGVPGTFYRHRIQLPQDLEGDMVLLQWYYLTANSCQHPGYDNYNLPADWNEDYSHLPICNVDDTDGGNGSPERFWNCAELTLTSDASPVSTSNPLPAPSAPVTSAPYAEPASTPTQAPVQTPTGRSGNCGGGSVGNGVCADTSLCCSAWGYCGSTADYCNGSNPPVTPAPIQPTAPTTPYPTRAPVTRAPSVNRNCESVPDAMTVNFGYYQSCVIWRQENCTRVYPADIDIAGNGYTHLAYSFASIPRGSHKLGHYHE